MASKKDIDFIKVIRDLKEAGTSNKVLVTKILGEYKISKIESLESKILNYVFSINDDDTKKQLINALVEADNLPIIRECYSIIYSGVSKEEYIEKLIKKDASNSDLIKSRYEKCIEIIELSSHLQEKFNFIKIILNLKEAGLSNKELLMNILCDNKTSKIESLERIILNYIFSIKVKHVKKRLVNILVEANNLPIIQECNSLINSSINEKDYIPLHAKKLKNTEDCIEARYDECIEIICLSSYLKEKSAIINAIKKLKEAGKNNKEKLMKILCDTEIPNIESLERRILNYVFSITDMDIKAQLMDMLAEANNLPIIIECNSIIYSNLPKEEYITGQVMKKIYSRKSIRNRYEKCMEIIELSSYLQEKLNFINEYKNSIDPKYIGIRVRNHKGRKRAASWGVLK